MFLELKNFLAPAEVETLMRIAHQGKFVDGKLSNPHNITKDSLIADPGDPLQRQAGQIGLAALQRSEAARNFVFPRRVAVPTLCRYGIGQRYGVHIDVAFLPVGPEPLRSDVSCTLFIADPASYEGGELVVTLGTGAVRIKGAPGTAIFYPSTTLHEVTPVTAGERVVMITFIESQIPDPMQRELLYTLGEVRALEGLKMDWAHRMQLEYVISNLQRMWCR